MEAYPMKFNFNSRIILMSYNLGLLQFGPPFVSASELYSTSSLLSKMEYDVESNMSSQ